LTRIVRYLLNGVARLLTLMGLVFGLLCVGVGIYGLPEMTSLQTVGLILVGLPLAVGAWVADRSVVRWLDQATSDVEPRGFDVITRR
jgi:hypothetical protein